MIERKNEEILLDGFREYLRNRGLKEKSVNDDISRIKMMERRNIDYTKGEDYARELMYNTDLSDSSIVSCLRVYRGQFSGIPINMEFLRTGPYT